MINNPIGIFDSGIGGLTVVKELKRRLPSESLIYIGDTARVPYGTRSPQTIEKFALEITKKLLDMKVKMLVVACNTISAVALTAVKQLANVQVIDVITPTVKEALKATQTGQIAVLGTAATISSGVYARELKKTALIHRVFEIPAPLLVPIAEEGLFEGAVAELMVAEYLKEVKADREIDTVILGCTHYPLFRRGIEKFLGAKVSVIDSAEPTAEAVENYLNYNRLRADGAKPTQIYFTSDDPVKSHKIASVFLGEEAELKKKSI